MSSDTNFIGNGSSIFKTIGLAIAGFTTPWLIKLALQYLGLDLTGQETQIMQSLGVIIGLGLSYIDMQYANSYFKKNITLQDYINYGEKHFGLTQSNDELSHDCDCDCAECTCEKINYGESDEG